MLTFIRFVKKPRTDITINIPMNKSEIYCTKMEKQCQQTHKIA